MRYAVLGAGPMGLVAALELLDAGHDVDVYERDDRLGGMSASFDFDGFPIERYYHFICRTDYPLFALLARFGLTEKLKWTATKMGYYYEGRLYPWGTPIALLEFPALGLVSKIRYALHVLYTKRISDWRPLDRVSATSWIRRWVGRDAYEVLWKRAFELKFFDYTERLSAAWIGTRIKRIALSRTGLLHESLGYLEGGSATLLTALAQEILRRGGRIHLRSGVDRVVAEGGRVAAVDVAGDRIPVDGVVSTAPIQYVPRLAPDLPDDFKKQIAAIDNIPVACVILKLSHPVTDNFWLNISDPHIAIPGLIEYSNLNPGIGPTIVYAPFYMPKTHPKWALGDDELIEEVLAYLPKINPAFSRDWVRSTHCHRYEFAQTICPPGFFDQLPPMRTPLKGFYMADTSYYYPEDRSISESIAVGQRLARVAQGQ